MNKRLKIKKDVTITNNRVAGVDGSCYSGYGVECTDSETCNAADNGSNGHTGNIGHSCLRIAHYICVMSEFT